MRVINNYNLYNQYQAECFKRKIRPSIPFLYKMSEKYKEIKTLEECFNETITPIVKVNNDMFPLQKPEEDIVLKEEETSDEKEETSALGRLLSVFKSNN